MSRIVALDISITATGAAWAVDGRITDYKVIPGKGEGIRRLMYDRDAIMDLVDREHPDLVVVEALSFGSKGSAVHDQAGLSKMVEAELVTEGIHYFTVAPMTNKKWCCGTAGSAKNPIRKEHMLKFMATRFHHDVSDNNVADALSLAYLGMAAIGEWECQIEPQRAVLETVWKANPWLRKMMKPAPQVEAVAAAVDPPAW